MSTTYRRLSRSRWFVPLFSLALGGLMLAAQSVGGHVRAGLFSLALMAGLGLVFAFGGRSETIRGLRGDGRDERFADIDLRATAFCGLVVIFGLIGLFLWDLAHGDQPGPYAGVMAIGGVAYVVAIVRLRTRG